MGITNFSVSLLYQHWPKKGASVCELGDQMTYIPGGKYGQYANWLYAALGASEYYSIDINGLNGSMVYDMGIRHSFFPKHDVLTDFGFSEHVGNNGAFSWEAVYNCWMNKHELLHVGGIMFNENPKTGNWPGHGFQWYTQDFYHQLCQNADYEIVDMGEHPAMGNQVDGWNVWCILRKTGPQFVSQTVFETFNLRTS